jgi:hypothetical protein
VARARVLLERILLLLPPPLVLKLFLKTQLRRSCAHAGR